MSVGAHLSLSFTIAGTPLKCQLAKSLAFSILRPLPKYFLRQITALRSIRNLDVHLVLSRLLCSARLVLYPQ